MIPGLFWQLSCLYLRSADTTCLSVHKAYRHLHPSNIHFLLLIPREEDLVVYTAARILTLPVPV